MIITLVNIMMHTYLVNSKEETILTDSVKFRGFP
jgi:hypothetical protein